MSEEERRDLAWRWSDYSVTLPSEGEPWTDVDWSAATRMEDWRSHVPEAMQEAWEDMAIEARIAVWVMATIAADRILDSQWQRPKRRVAAVAS